MSEHINIARIKKGSDVFEVVINPDQAMAFRKNPSANIMDAVVYPKIFSDAKKGMLASEQRMDALFKTSDPLEVAKIIIKEGEIQVTAEYRQKIIEQKRRRIIDIIHRNGVDPRTNLPHPLARIETAMNEAKVRIDEYKAPEAQVQEVLKSLRVILPIKFVIKEIEVKIPGQFAGKAFGTVKLFGKVLSENWLGDGSWQGVVEIPGGLEMEFYDKLNSITHGNVEAKAIKTKE